MTFRSPGGTVISPGSDRYQEMQEKFRQQEECWFLVLKILNKLQLKLFISRLSS